MYFGVAIKLWGHDTGWIHFPVTESLSLPVCLMSLSFCVSLFLSLVVGSLVMFP